MLCDSPNETLSVAPAFMLLCHTRTLDSSGSRRVQSSSAQLNLVIDRERLLIINPTVQTWCKVVTDIPFWECTEYIRGGGVKAQPWLPAAAANEQPKPQPPYIFAVEYSYSSYSYSLLQVAGVRHLRRALIINTVCTWRGNIDNRRATEGPDSLAKAYQRYLP